MEALEKEQKRIKKVRKKQNRQMNLFGLHFSNEPKEKPPQKLLSSSSGKVVAFAAAS